MGVFDTNNRRNETEISALSETWQELLGVQSYPEQPWSDDDEAVSLLASDPWSQLLSTEGFEVVDLQQVRIEELHTPAYSIEAEVDQVLRMMNENPYNELY